jgi:hypothetical protein
MRGSGILIDRTVLVVAGIGISCAVIWLCKRDASGEDGGGQT